MTWKFWQRAGELEREEVEGLKKSIAEAILREEMGGLYSRIKDTTPVAEGALLERFAGAGDNPLFLGVCQVIDESYDALVHEARGGHNTEKQTNMLLGGQEALDVLKKNLVHYAAASAAREVAAEEKKD